ncbi:MAG: hypothetical protein H7X86_04195 [Gorillibacterium sp.]|nr:hypothetical protein [Gorillibacterium sp.]
MRILCILLLTVLITLVPGLIGSLESAEQETIIDYAKEGSRVYALVKQKGPSGYRDYLVINQRVEKGQDQQIFKKDFMQLKPWKIEIADMDGDHEQEIIIAVHKTTHFDAQEKNRLFILNFDGERLYKKWTGSQIAGVWNDFHAEDFLPIQGDELIFIEQVSDNRERICIYYWFDFGFVLLAASEVYGDITAFCVIGENRIQITSHMGQEKKIRTLMVDNGKMIEVDQIRIER